MTDTFQLAVVRAKAAYTEGGWLSLNVTEQCHAIYLELRRLDAEIRGRFDKEQLKGETAMAAE